VGRTPLTAVIAEHSARLLDLPGVVGIGEGADDSGPFVGVLLASDDPALAARIPVTLDGYPVRVSVTGRLTAGQDRQAP